MKSSGSKFAVSLTVVLGMLLCGCDHSPADREIRYFTFQKPGKSIEFEPSGISRIGNYDFIVINDTNREAPLSVYRFTKPNKLKEVGRFDFKTAGKSVKAFKLEAITRSRKTPETFYAATAYDRKKAEYNLLVRFKLDKTYRAVEVEVLNLYHPGKYLFQTLKQKWCKLEALCFSHDDRALLIGVRAVGKNSENPRYRVIILQYSLKALNRPPQTLVDVNLEGVLGRSEGISALIFSPVMERYLLLTSFEDDNRNRVGGHLWVVPRDLSQLNRSHFWKTLPRIPFTHKPEGLELLSDQEVIIVFDDDHYRKSGLGKKRKFKLAPNEAVFTTVSFEVTFLLEKRKVTQRKP